MLAPDGEGKEAVEDGFVELTVGVVVEFEVGGIVNWQGGVAAEDGGSYRWSGHG